MMFLILGICVIKMGLVLKYSHLYFWRIFKFLLYGGALNLIN